ncbi:MAG: anti-sigma factor [Burkholderiales bacterium]|nr:anti-sigma factor [Burkholderiales bacterium]
MTYPNESEPLEAALDASLRELHREVLAEPVPPSLRDAALRLEQAQRDAASNRRWGTMAASFVLSVGVGWFSHGFMLQHSTAGSQAKVSVEREFVRQASFAYDVYLPEKRHPVEVTAAEHEHLVLWLSKRLGKPLQIPKLSAQGFELVGGRLLPGETGARAQFMFQDTQGRRLTLYMGALETASAHMDSQSAQFRFEPGGAVPSFYWVEGGFGYALSGLVDKATLMALASSVYGQIH